MAFDVRSVLDASCPYEVRRQGRLCPYAVQVALATDRSRVPGSSEGAIASMDMITAWDATSRALARLWKQHGGAGGSPSPVGEGRAEKSEGRRVSEH